LAITNRAFLALAGGDGGGELWPVIVALARLNLGELGNQRPAALRCSRNRKPPA
jgi:hypothetical protein